MDSRSNQGWTQGLGGGSLWWGPVLLGLPNRLTVAYIFLIASLTSSYLRSPASLQEFGSTESGLGGGASGTFRQCFEDSGSSAQGFFDAESSLL